MPNPLPLAWMNPQNEVRRASSPALKPGCANWVSVTPNVTVVVGAAWIVVPQATIPAARLATGTLDALQVVPDVAIIFTTIEVGRAGVRVLLMRSLTAESDTNAFGVTVQEQQEINCSSGEKAYTFAQMFVRAPPAFWVPALVILM